MVVLFYKHGEKEGDLGAAYLGLQLLNREKEMFKENPTMHESKQEADILDGDSFIASNGKEFEKGKKLRKRFSCTQKDTNRVYLFHPLAEVSKIQ